MYYSKSLMQRGLAYRMLDNKQNQLSLYLPKLTQYYNNVREPQDRRDKLPI